MHGNDNFPSLEAQLKQLGLFSIRSVAIVTPEGMMTIKELRGIAADITKNDLVLQDNGEVQRLTVHPRNWRQSDARNHRA